MDAAVLRTEFSALQTHADGLECELADLRREAGRLARTQAQAAVEVGGVRSTRRGADGWCCIGRVRR